MTISAIDGYERLGATRMVEIMKSSFVCGVSYPEVANSIEIPDGYLDNFKPIADSFDKVDALYYAEVGRLPGSENVDNAYPIGPIDYYYENFPEDIARSQSREDYPPRTSSKRRTLMPARGRTRLSVLIECWKALGSFPMLERLVRK